MRREEHNVGRHCYLCCSTLLLYPEQQQFQGRRYGRRSLLASDGLIYQDLSPPSYQVLGAILFEDPGTLHSKHPITAEVWAGRTPPTGKCNSVDGREDWPEHCGKLPFIRGQRYVGSI